MNWLRSDYPYAEVRLTGADGELARAATALDSEVQTRREGDTVRTTITLRNNGSKPYFAGHGSVGLTLPLQDQYDLSVGQSTQRCNVHLACHGSSSYVVAFRMGGEPPHLGLVLTEGALNSYSVDRDLDKGSNDRGCFILNLAPFELQPGQSTTVSWVIFPFVDMEDFYATAGRLTRFVRAEWDRYVLFAGEKAELTITASFRPGQVTVNGVPLLADTDGRYRLRIDADRPGELVFDVAADDRTVRTTLLVKADLETLLENRCRFIASNQQYRGPDAALHGALLAYDNETESVFYSPVNDFNAARERVGMGVLLALYLAALTREEVSARHPDTESTVRASLDEFAKFVRRELIHPETGEAFNDVGRNADVRRLYNAPWYTSFFVSLFELDGDREDLLIAVRIVRRFYEDGGTAFYPIELPILRLCSALEGAGLLNELEEIRELFHNHARRIATNGPHYPRLEVNYEQSIVAPAVVVLLETYLITGDEDLLDVASEHLRALEQFQGMQPDYHLNEVAIRHWDGYWFGKLARFGDTFPHYWSGLTGNAFSLWSRARNEEAYAARADRSLRGVLPLIFDDGRASCAYVYPHAVNGVRARGFDPFANDQDWGLTFALRRLREDLDSSIRPGLALATTAPPRT